MLFCYGKVVSGELFYDRVKAQKELKTLVNNGQSFMLKAPRRYGKTSIIKHILQNDEYFYIDLRKVPHLELLNKKLLEYVYSLMGITGALKQLKENAISFLRSHRTTITVSVGIFESSVELFTSDKSDEDKFIGILETLKAISQEKKGTIKIVFDEFQEIKKLSKKVDLAEVLRAEIQHREKVCYMFAGSNMTMMTELFEKASSPFYNFGRKAVLNPFDEKELSVEVIAAFKNRGIIFEKDELIHDLIKRCDGHPANTMLVLQIIEFTMQTQSLNTITEQIVDKCYCEAQLEMNDLVMEYLKEIRTKEHLHDVIFKEANNIPQTLDASSLQQKRKALVDMGHLQIISRGKYKIIDNFLRDELINEAI